MEILKDQLEYLATEMGVLLPYEVLVEMKTGQENHKVLAVVDRKAGSVSGKSLSGGPLKNQALPIFVEAFVAVAA